MSRSGTPGGTDVTVIGGGLIGMATAHRLLQARPGLRVTVVEAAPSLAAGQSGHNSNVIHSGAFYSPESDKAALATRGREEMEAFIDEHGLPLRRTGKLIVQVDASETHRFDDLARRAEANGVGASILADASAIAELEPAISPDVRRALWLPRVAVTDFSQVLGALAQQVRHNGGDVRLGVTASLHDGKIQVSGEPLDTRHTVVAAGLGSNALGSDPGWRIVGFQGAYRAVEAPAVRRLVYGVPDPRYPFLGVHLTPDLEGNVTAGPTATLHQPIPIGRVMRLAAHDWRQGLTQLRLRLSPGSMQQEARAYVPGVRIGRKIVKAGVRAQAVDRRGRYADDFVFLDRPGTTFVANAPSPGATACLAIGDRIARRALEALEHR